MAKVLITHFSGMFFNGKFQSGCFYEGLIKSLIACGNDVLVLITSDFIADPWNGTNRTLTRSMHNALLKKIKEFNPDLVISFNNSSIAKIEEYLDCPIALWDADAAAYFNDKDKISNNLDRYIFLAFSSNGVNAYQKVFGVSENSITMVPVATAITSQKLDKQYNISFIGNPFTTSSRVESIITRYPEIIQAIRNKDLIKLQSYNKILQDINLDLATIEHACSGSLRTKLVSLLMDLDCYIFGPANWLQMVKHIPEVAYYYQKKMVYSLQHNELVYNRSKISLNISHAQNLTGYSWRIPDILASDAVLLSDYKQDLVSHFGKDINLQIYNSPADAYNIARKLLNDHALRDDIIAQSNAVIDFGHRWHHRFPLIRQATGVDLQSNSQTVGSYDRLCIDYKCKNFLSDIIYETKDLAFDLTKYMSQHRIPKNLTDFKQFVKYVAPDYLKWFYIKKQVSKMLDHKEYA